MFSLLLAFASRACAFDVGWQPLPDGGFEYIIQFDPETLASLRAGQDVLSDVPPRCRQIRNYRIAVGSAEVPRTGEPPRTLPTSDSPMPPNDSFRTPLGALGWKPLSKGGYELVVQLDPATCDDLASGKSLASELPPFLRDVRTYRITTQLDRLPSPPVDPGTIETGLAEGDPGPPAAEPPPAAESPPASGPDLGDPAGNLASADLAGVDPAKDEATESGGEPASAEGPESSLVQKPIVKNAALEARRRSNGNSADGQDPGGSDPGPTGSPTADLSGSPLPSGDQPWLPLTLSLVALCVSLSTNVYMVWVTWATRQRYRDVVQQLALKQIMND